MSEENSQASTSDKCVKEQWVKRALILALILAMVGVYLYQRRGLTIRGWGEDLPAALSQAKAENRPLVVMFVNKMQTPTARTLRGHIAKPGNQKALKEGRYITVIVPLDNSLDSDLALKYKVKILPTLLLLGPDGVELNRATGNIGEVPFRATFLNYSP